MNYLEGLEGFNGNRQSLYCYGYNAVTCKWYLTQVSSDFTSFTQIRKRTQQLPDAKFQNKIIIITGLLMHIKSLTVQRIISAEQLR